MTNVKYRHELKYYLNYHQYFLIRQKLKHLMAHDHHGNETGDYHVRSLYFDDSKSSALFDKQSGVKERNKFRIRIYNLDDHVIHFEKKIKNNDHIAKVKHRVSRKMVEEILTENYQAINIPEVALLQEIFYEMKHRLLRPIVLVDYVREAYISPFGNVRITFDKELKTGLQAINIFDKNLRMVRAIDENFILLEIKYDEFIPEYLQQALQLDGLYRRAASKYVICRKFTKMNEWEDQ